MSKLEHVKILSHISVLEVLVQSCQDITAWIESGQQRGCDECHVISLTVVNISTDTFSRGYFIFSGHGAQIRSDNTSDVAYINPQSGLFSCQLLTQAQKRSKHLASQKLGTDHVGD